jgi:4-hydroxy 2-oxovalerate aldolase
MQNCHPNYVQYLLDKKTLSVSSVNDILEQIPGEIKLLYNQAYIENAYIEYQSKNIDDSEAIDRLRNELNGRTIVLLGPGSTIHTEEKSILEFIRQSRAVVISVNFEAEDYLCDYVFVSNAKRYSKLADCSEQEAKPRLIITSNISAFDRQPDYILNYQGLIQNDVTNRDIAMLLAIAALVKCGIRSVYLAGFDGFSSEKDNYYDAKWLFIRTPEQYEKGNEDSILGLKALSEHIDIHFLTESLYVGYFE